MTDDRSATNAIASTGVHRAIAGDIWMAAIGCGGVDRRSDLTEGGASNLRPALGEFAGLVPEPTLGPYRRVGTGMAGGMIVLFVKPP